MAARELTMAQISNNLLQKLETKLDALILKARRDPRKEDDWPVSSSREEDDDRLVSPPREEDEVPVSSSREEDDWSVYSSSDDELQTPAIDETALKNLKDLERTCKLYITAIVKKWIEFDEKASAYIKGMENKSEKDHLRYIWNIMYQCVNILKHNFIKTIQPLLEEYHEDFSTYGVKKYAFTNRVQVTGRKNIDGDFQTLLDRMAELKHYLKGPIFSQMLGDTKPFLNTVKKLQKHLKAFDEELLKYCYPDDYTPLRFRHGPTYSLDDGSP